MNEDVFLIEEMHQDDKNNPFFYRRVRLSYEKENAIIDTLNIKEQVVKDLRSVIEQYASEIINDLKSCNDKFNLIQQTYNDLRNELNNVIHDSEVVGVYGNCRIEDRLKLRRRIIKKLRCVFTLKHNQ